MLKRHKTIYWISLISIVGTILILALGIGFRRSQVETTLHLAESAYRGSDWTTSEKLARVALRSRPDDPRALLVLARSMERLGLGERAKTVYTRLGEDQLKAEDFYLLGRDLLDRGDPKLGLAALNAARTAQPDHPETLDALSKYWTDTQKLSDARDAATRLAKIQGWEVRGHVRLARIRSELGEPGEAADLLDAALEADPNLDRTDLKPNGAIKFLARCRLRAGQPAGAIDALRLAMNSSDGPEVEWLKSRAYLQLGDAANATRALERAGGERTTDPLAAEPAAFVGAAGCANCHKSEYGTQQQSRHANTLVPTWKLPDVAWPSGAIADSDVANVSHQFTKSEAGVAMATTVGNETFRAIIAFALGSGHQGQSFVARQPNGQIRELRISRYPRAPEWSRTMEHPATLPDADGYLGRPITEDAFRKCLNCHSTSFRSMLAPDGHPESRDRGIGCERCHGPAGNHIASVATKFPDPAIARPRLATPAQVVNLCGDCHKASASVSPDSPSYVRFQASTLVLSRCYVETGEGLSCTACHNPHKNAETRASYYEAKCLACHRAGAPVTDGPRARTVGRSCPVNPTTGCMECHMPKAREAIPRTVFTDHQIRIHRTSLRANANAKP